MYADDFDETSNGGESHPEGEEIAEAAPAESKELEPTPENE